MANNPNFSLNCNGQLLKLNEPKVMGIINSTPDSFYSDSRTKTVDNALKQATQMLDEGAAILDIGGMSSRPGAEMISSETECERVLSIINAVSKEFPNAILSIDTIYSETAKQAFEAGVAIVNDISAGNLDQQMIPTVAKLGCPYIAMHMRGTPQNMKELTNYDDLLLNITDYFIAKTIECKEAGIKDIVIDPGFGFAKTIEQNFELLANLNTLQFLDFPILAGLSRKSMIWKTLNTTPEQALNGTTALNMLALQQGAKILRVHDVKEAVECVKLYQQLNQ